MIRNTFTALLCLGATAAIIPSAAIAAEAPIYTSWKNNVGAGGYDVISFYSGVPVKGSSEFTAEYEGAQWTFSTSGNLDLFKANPAAFAPQYGGYCAWALAQNKLAKGNPKYWTVEDGKLYLNYNARIKTRWENDKASFIEKGNLYWPSVLDK